MSEEMVVGCARPTGGPVGEPLDQSPDDHPTPSGWKPGKITLKPGPDLVGKVLEAWKTDMAFD